MSKKVEIPYKPSKEPKVEFVPFDGLKFKTVLWQRPSNTEYKGRILYVHGFSEDSLIYTEFFDRLSNRGYDIFFFDQRGAGETSPGKEEGKTTEFHAFNDLDFFVKRAVETSVSQEDKLILMGHLMGGGIVLNYGIRGKYKDYIKTIIAVAPEVLLHPATEPNFLLKTIGNVGAKLFPNLRLDAGLVYEYLTTNQKWIDYIKAHNKKFWMAGGLYTGMVNRGIALTKPDYVAKFDPNIAVLVVHSADDKINWIEGSKKFYGLLHDNVQKDFLTLNGAGHSICIETDQYVNALLDKIEEFNAKY